MNLRCGSQCSLTSLIAIVLAMLSIRSVATMQLFPRANAMGHTMQGFSSPAPGTFLITDLEREHSVSYMSPSGKPLKIDVALTRSGLSSETSYRFPGKVYVGNADVIPGRMPWNIVYRAMPKEEVDLTFTRTYCPHSKALTEAQFRVTGSPERTGNSPGKVRLSISDYDAELQPGKAVKGTLGQGVMYHYFDVVDGSQPVYLRANAYFPNHDVADGGLDIFISKDACPDVSRYQTPLKESCDVQLSYNQDTTTYGLSLNTTMDTSGPQELTFFLPQTFYDGAEFTDFDVYGDDVSGHTHSGRAVVVVLRGDTGANSRAGKPKSRKMKGIMVRAYSGKLATAKEFGYFALNGRKCQTKVNIYHNNHTLLESWVSEDPRELGKVACNKWNTKDGIYRLGGNGAMPLTRGRYFVAVVWERPYGLLGYELGFWRGQTEPVLMLPNNVTLSSSAVEMRGERSHFSGDQDTLYPIPLQLQDDAGENRPIVELELSAEKGTKLMLQDTRDVVITSKDYRVGDFVQSLSFEGSSLAIQRILNSFAFIQSDKYFAGSSKLNAKLTDKSCFACKESGSKSYGFSVDIEFAKIDHALEFQMKHNRINIVQEKGPLKINDFLKNIHSVDVDGDDFKNSMSVVVQEISELNATVFHNMPAQLKPDFQIANQNAPSDRILRRPPQLVLSSDSRRAYLELDLTGEFGKVHYTVSVKSPSATKNDETLIHSENFTVGVYPRDCNVTILSDQNYVSLFKPATINVSLTCEPYDQVVLPIQLSKSGIADPSIESLRFTPTDWKTKVIVVRGTETDSPEDFKLIFGPMKSEDERYSEKQSTLDLVNRKNRDDCTKNDHRWWCQDPAAGSAVQWPLIPLRLHLLSILVVIFNSLILAYE